MSEAKTDPEDFKATQRQAWGEAATGWRKWWRIFEAAAQPLNEKLVDLAGERPGQVVLDVATGIGEPALTAARRVGARGSVVAIDFAAPMLEVGRERARAEGLSNLEFLERDAETLSLEGRRFDAATCRWGFMLMPDPRAACAAVRSCLKPGAHLAAAVWAEPEKVPFIALPQAIGLREGLFPPPPHGSPGPFSMGRAGQLEEVMAAAGFQGLRSETFRVAFRFDSPREYTTFVQEVSGSLRRGLQEAPRERREHVLRAIEVEVRRYAAPDGSVHFENEARCASGRC